MSHTLRTASVCLAAGAVSVLAMGSLGARGQQPPRAPVAAIRNAKIVTVTGATIDKGTIVMRNGIITDVGPSVTVPPDATVLDGTGLTVYPGAIDMANSSAVEEPATAPAAAAAAAPQAGRGGRGVGGAGTIDETWAGNERNRRESVLNPDFEAALHVRYEGDELRQLASAGITSVLAVPNAGVIRGQSALVNTMAAPDRAEISSVGGYRRGYVVVRTPVALHVAFTAGRGGGGGGGAYPAALLGVLAFIRQSFYDAAWQRDARAFAARHADAPPENFEPALDALAPALGGTMPVAFDAGEAREILRAIGFAKEFKLKPIIIGGLEASAVIDDLKATNAQVIFTLGQSGGAAGGGRGGGGSARVTRMRQNATKVPAALDKAGVPFAFSSQGLSGPAEFIRAVARTIADGLAAETALKALTIDAAKMAGVSDRLGSIEKGKIANLVVTDGDWFDAATHIKNVFVAGWLVDAAPAPPPATTGRRGGGGGRRPNP